MADSVDVLEPGHRAAVEHPAAALARAGADVDDPVRAPYDVEVVLHDEQRVAGRLQPVQDLEQRLGVGRVQAGGRLVQHVDDPEQPGAQLGGDPQALRLAGRTGSASSGRGSGSPGPGRASTSIRATRSAQIRTATSLVAVGQSATGRSTRGQLGQRQAR